jgi:hypothetical protein
MEFRIFPAFTYESKQIRPNYSAHSSLGAEMTGDTLYNAAVDSSGYLRHLLL